MELIAKAILGFVGLIFLLMIIGSLIAQQSESQSYKEQERDIAKW